MGNWSSTNKASTTAKIDASAFKEEKAPNPGTAARSVAADGNSPQTPVVIQQPKPQVATSNSGGMRALTALDTPLK